MKKKLNKIVGCIGLFVCSIVSAQQFKYSAPIADTITAKGFYAIPVTASLSSYIKTDYRDLRIIDELGKQIPFIVKPKYAGYNSSNYHPLKIVSNSTDSSKTVLIISNDLQQKINELILTIRNTSVSRYANISGSDDGVHWYTIQENVLLDNIANTDGDKFLQHLHFSVSSYKYFKIGIANGKNDPLNIINAGWYLADDNYLTVSTTANPSPSFLQKDSAGISYIFVTSRMPFHTDRIYLRVQAPRFFKRAVEVIILNRSLQHFDISSDSIFVFDVPLFKTTQWQIKIYNGDNPPVKVVAVETSATAKEVITYLETGHHYSLLLSSDSATMPLYDLENFKDSITTARVINISDIKPLATTTTTDKNIFKKNWLWPILISILVLVIFFTWKLSKEVEHKK